MTRIMNNKVPTNAIVTYVTTRKNGNSYTNGGSLMGGTLLWIFGKSKVIKKKGVGNSL